MPLPNLLIVGSQKAGTTWLHSSLSKSVFIHGSSPKELFHFNRKKYRDPTALQDYEAHFPETDGVQFYMESTPHYFRVPRGDVDVARNIAEVLGQPRIIAVLRDPVDRYESAYVHHMITGRLPYAEVIDEVSDEVGMVTLGRYGASLHHWLPHFPGMNVLFYDDLVADPVSFISNVMSWLGIDNDIPPSAVLFRTNETSRRIRNRRQEWERTPVLSSRLRSELRDLYRPDVLVVEELTGRSLPEWRT